MLYKLVFKGDKQKLWVWKKPVGSTGDALLEYREFDPFIEPEFEEAIDTTDEKKPIFNWLMSNDRNLQIVTHHFSDLRDHLTMEKLPLRFKVKENSSFYVRYAYWETKNKAKIIDSITNMQAAKYKSIIEKLTHTYNIFITTNPLWGHSYSHEVKAFHYSQASQDLSYTSQEIRNAIVNQFEKKEADNLDTLLTIGENAKSILEFIL
ncbi:MAG: hypothetical protein RMZ69_11375 [Nostoc sp. ChiQUE01a]|nr:hypothetical protein [Nostoc sp. ChiQUE01a]